MKGEILNEIKDKIEKKIEDFVLNYQQNEIRHYITYCEECVKEVNDFMKFKKVPEDAYIELSNRYRKKIQAELRKVS